MYIEVVVSIAQVRRMRGDYASALQILNEAMQRSPTASSPYVLASVIYKEAGQMDEAMAVLLKGNEELAGDSAEIHYFLAYSYMDLDDLDHATEHAARAYELGYPLPGLANKLKRLGRAVN